MSHRQFRASSPVALLHPWLGAGSGRRSCSRRGPALEGIPIIDGVPGVGSGSSRREIVFRLVESVDAVERLALLDPVADLLEQPDAGALVERRARGACQAI